MQIILANMLECYNKFMKNKIIGPFNLFKILTDALHLIIILVLLFDFSIFLFYDYDQIFEGQYTNVLRVSIGFFVFTMLLTFMTGFYSEGKIQVDPIIIAKKYIRTNFIFDFVSVICLFYLMYNH